MSLSRRAVEATHPRRRSIAQIAANAKRIELVERFRGGERLFVAGSTWGPDEELLIETTPTALTKAKMAFDYRILDAQTGTVLVTGHTQNVYTSRETGHIERLTDKYWSILKRAMEQEKKQGALSTSAAPQGKGEA